MAIGKKINYLPSPQNEDYLIEKQAEYNKVHPAVGLQRIVDLEITRIRKMEKDIAI
jgi:hypothetical protein